MLEKWYQKHFKLYTFGMFLINTSIAAFVLSGKVNIINGILGILNGFFAFVWLVVWAAQL